MAEQRSSGRPRTGGRRSSARTTAGARGRVAGPPSRCLSRAWTSAVPGHRGRGRRRQAGVWGTPGRTPIPLGRRASRNGPLRRPSAESSPSRPRSAMPAPSKNTTRPRSLYARSRGPRPGHDCAQSLSDCPYGGRPTRIGALVSDAAPLTHKTWIRTESVPRRRPATQFRQPQGKLRPRLPSATRRHRRDEYRTPAR